MANQIPGEEMNMKGSSAKTSTSQSRMDGRRTDLSHLIDQYGLALSTMKRSPRLEPAPAAP
jgi:hypothetical protein